MTSCVAVSKTSVVVSSIDVDKCFVYAFDTARVIDLTERLGEAYRNMPINNRDLQKACAAFSDDGKLFAYNPNKGKLLSVWNTADWSPAGNRTLAKHATDIVFTPRTDVIVVGDKKGDVYAFEELPVRVLGHSSMVLDICFSGDEKYIVTCDSDEKVRVSHYPNGKNILHYMMGHEAYVSGVCVLNDCVLSGSGDRTLRLWDLNTGDTLDTFVASAPVRSVVEIDGMAAVQLHDSGEVRIVKTRRDERGRTIETVGTVELDDVVSTMAARADGLWIVAGNAVHRYAVDSRNGTIAKVENDETKRTFQTLDRLVKSFVCLENTNLMIFLYKKMIEKQNRTGQHAHDPNRIVNVTQYKKLRQH